MDAQRLLTALKAIVALDLGRDAIGRDDFYSGPDRFFRAHAIAREAVAKAEGTPEAGSTAPAEEQR